MVHKLRNLFLFLPCIWTLLPLSYGHLLAARQAERQVKKNPISIEDQEAEDECTINFRNIPIIEYIKFVSKIVNLNFIYHEEELTFNITIISEEPMRRSEVFSTLAQILKVNGFSLIEQDHQFMVTKVGTVKQIPPVVSPELLSEQGQVLPPVITQVFKIHHADPNQLAQLIKPLLSPDAIIEASEKTAHLIVTDTTSNVQEIHKLLLSLDLPSSTFQLASYSPQYHNTEHLAPLAKQLVASMADGVSVTIIPSDQMQTLFIVSTPVLIEKTLSVLKELDAIPALREAQGPINSDNVLIYPVQHQTIDILQTALQQIQTNLSRFNPNSGPLIKALQLIHYVRATNSLFVVASPTTLKEVHSILSSLDIPIPSEDLLRDKFFIYHAQKADETRIIQSLNKFAKQLQKAGNPNYRLIHSIQSAQWIEENHTLNFNGDKDTIAQLEKLLPVFDVESESKESLFIQEFFIYRPKHQSGKELCQQLKELHTILHEAHLTHTTFLNVLNTVKWIDSSQTLVIAGNAESLEKIKGLIQTLDHSFILSEHCQLFVYPVQFSPPTYILEGLKQLAKALPHDVLLFKTIEQAQFLEETRSFVFQGADFVIEYIKGILSSLDNQEVANQLSKNELFVYQPNALSTTELQRAVLQAAQEMGAVGFEDTQLIHALESVAIVSDGQTLMFTGPANSMEKVREMVQNFDQHHSPSALSELFIYKPKTTSVEQFQQEMLEAAKKMERAGLKDVQLIRALNSAQVDQGRHHVTFTGTITAIEKVKVLVNIYDSYDAMNTFYIYTPRHQSSETIIAQAHQMAAQMEKTGFANESLISALHSSSLTSHGTGVLFTGTNGAIELLKQLLPDLDTKEHAFTELYIYHPIAISVEKFLEHVKTFIKEVSNSRFMDSALVNTLKSARFLSHAQAVIFTGTKESLARLQELLPVLDTKDELSSKEEEGKDYRIYKIQHLSGEALMKKLRMAAQELSKSKSGNRALIHTLRSMRYVAVTHSIVFSGTAAAIVQAEALAAKIDMADMMSGVDGNKVFAMYTPRALPGKELIKMVKEFKGHLMESRVNNAILFETIDCLQWMETTSTILIAGDQSSVTQVEHLLQRFDGSLSGTTEAKIVKDGDITLLTYKLEYHHGREVLTAVKQIGTEIQAHDNESKKMLMEAIQALQYIEVTNSLVSTGHPAALDKLKELISAVDIPVKQVFVEVLVIETSTTNVASFGLRWGGKGNYDGKVAFAGGLFPAASEKSEVDFDKNLHNAEPGKITGDLIPFSDGFGLGVIGDMVFHDNKLHITMGSLVDSLQRCRDSTIVLNQKLITQDNKNSTLFVGHNIPYVGSVIKNIGPNTTTTTNLEYRDVGVSLNITPTVGHHGVVTLSIVQDITEQVSPTLASVSRDAVSGVTTSRASTQTVVSLPDKHFLVISGQIHRTTERARHMPCLGGLPGISSLFQHRNTNKSHNNLLIFIRPCIINSFETYQEVTDHQESLYRQEANAEDFDAGLELVKTPEDEEGD